MRITCPNCGAQYEVPDEVIPAEGRDVQCSNCGDTWYQYHPDHEPAEAEQPPVAEPDPEFFASQDETEESYDYDDDFDDEPSSVPQQPGDEPEEDVEPEPSEAEEDEYEEEPAPAVAARKRELDPAVANILREEAEYEARRRAAEGLESQGELGLDSVPPAEGSRESRERMARLRGEVPDDGTGRERTRSRLLPDVEEINSTLRTKGELTPKLVDEPEEEPVRRGGFARGFSLIVLLAAALVLIYVNAGRISEAAPSLAPALQSYVSLVDGARIWLDSKLSGFIPQ